MRHGLPSTPRSCATSTRTDSPREARDGSPTGKGRALLGTGRKQSPEDSPEATIHLAYYIMLHAAAAVLIERIGQTPKTHGGIVSQFSRQVSATEQGRLFARALSRAGTRRFVSDYDDETVPSVESAAQLCHAARDFLAYSRSLL